MFVALTFLLKDIGAERFLILLGSIPITSEANDTLLRHCGSFAGY